MKTLNTSWLFATKAFFSCFVLMLFACLPQGGKEERIKHKHGAEEHEHGHDEKKTLDAAAVDDCDEKKAELLLEDHEHEEGQEHEEGEEHEEEGKTTEPSTEKKPGKITDDKCKKTTSTEKETGKEEGQTDHDHD